MNPALRITIDSDYYMIASWIPDATSCARWAGPHLRFPFLPQELPELLMVPNSSSLSMAEDNGVLLGFGQFWRRGKSLVHLGRIIVSPHRLGRGYGKTLCNLLIAEALSATNAEIISLRVYRDNAPAFSIYSNLGFRIVEPESNAEVFAMEARANTTLLESLRDKVAQRR
jgi:ribosomal-protein-alanine N-acetyltransferase